MLTDTFQAITAQAKQGKLRPAQTRFDRNGLERLRDEKRSRDFYRLESPRTAQHEFRDPHRHASNYAYVRLECAPADDLSFEARVSWPPTSLGEGPVFERAIAEIVADELLSGVDQHSGCEITLVEVSRRRTDTVRMPRIGSFHVGVVYLSGR